MKNKILILLICIFLAIPLNVEATSISPLISYQGILKDSSGNLINNTVSLTFKIFNHSTSGSLLWQETKDVQVNNGLFTTQLGDVTPMNPAQFDQALWLEIVVGVNTLSPRQQLMGAPYAFSLAPGAIVSGDKIANGSIAAEKLARKYADSNQSCLVGKVVTGIDANGKIICGDNPLEARIAALENKLNGVNRSGNDISFDGMNVHITSGSGATNGAINGLGNLIIGYNELRGYNDNRSGSHNLILGSWNNYGSYGGLVAGSFNEISGVYSSVSGGNTNIASGELSSVSGGIGNKASGELSSVSGGAINTASGKLSSVSGGDHNTARNYSSSASGGYGNLAYGDYSSISGGNGNTASNYSSSVSGGDGNIANGMYSSVSGGNYNTASGYHSSVSGGRSNTAREYWSSVSGGKSNIASGYSSSVSGGRSNTASGEESSVSGGISRSAIGWGNWAAGGLFQDT